MNKEIGSDSGCFAMAPYETRCESLPKKRAMSVVSFPPTQLSPSLMSCLNSSGKFQIKVVESTHLASCPLLDFALDRLVRKFVIGKDMRCA